MVEETIALECIFIHLIDSVQSALKILKGPAKGQLNQHLHDSTKLPHKEIADLANQAIDVLHEAEQLLQPGSLVLADHFLGYSNSKCLSAAVQYNVPDILCRGPMTLTELVTASNTRKDRLRQVMRSLYNNGIFSYDDESGVYANNRISELLASSHPSGWCNWVELYGSEFYNMASGIPAACARDAIRSPSQIHYDIDDSLFVYFKKQGWIPRLHKTLGAGAAAQAPGILADYPWEQIADGEVLDIGGGGGNLIALLLRAHKSMSGAILERPEVIEHTSKKFHSPEGEFNDVGDRVRLVSGDFFASIPISDYYTMKWCLHDWDDSGAMKIMLNVRKAIKRGHKSRFVILESILSDGRSSRLSRYADLNMWIAVNGQERTAAEWKRLAENTGWKINNIYTLRNAWPCAIELFPDYSFKLNTKAEAEGETSLTNGIHAKSNGVSEPTIAKANGYTNPEISESYKAVMSFLEPWDSQSGSPFFRSACAPGFQPTNFKWQDHTVSIANARPQKSHFTLDNNAFAYLDDPGGAPPPSLLQALRSGDKQRVTAEYYPRVEALLKTFTGASRIILFDHTTRKRDPNRNKVDNPNGAEQPATTVHCDQGERGAIRRLRMHLRPSSEEEEDADAFLLAAPSGSRRVQILNVWRPLRGPVRDWPLAQMDYSSLRAKDVHPVDLWRGAWEDRGQTMTFTYDEGQRWYYLDGHRTDEVTILKIWDSKKGVAACCPHAAFGHPGTPVGCEPRESVEVRCLVIY